jgi:glucose/arabinose dehydrogenase
MKRYYFICLLLSSFSYSAWAQAGLQLVDAFPKLTVSFANPIEVTHAGDNSKRIFVARQSGVIHVFPNDTNVTNAQVLTFLDLSSKLTFSGEAGLLGLAFDPDYLENGYFYLNYTRTLQGQLESVISRFSVSREDANKADPTSELILLTFNQPFSNHNGGKITFGPDGYLYIATGDGGSGGDPQNNSQNLGNLLGKILRINVHALGKPYALPADNPFVNTAGARPEIFAYGLRNPWRMSIDRRTGQIWAGDVGQNAREEVDLIVKGGNYGWRLREGKGCYNPSVNCPTENLIDPVWEYTHASGDGRSITGGLVYRGEKLPDLKGKYVYGDFVTGNIWALTYDANSRVATNEFVLKLPGTLSAFGEDENSDLFICNYSTGRIHKLKDPLVLASERPVANSQWVSVFPNPADEQLRIRLKLSKPEPTTVRLYSIQGKLVYTALENKAMASSERTFLIDTKALPAGMYVYRLDTGTTSHTGKVQITR